MLQTTPFLITFLMGNYLENCLDEEDYSIKGMGIASLVAVLSLSFSMGCAIFQIYNTGNVFDTTMYGRVFYTPTLLMSASIYYIAKYVWMNYSFGRIDHIILHIGSCTFGIYLLGDFLRDFLVGISDFLKTRLPEIVSVLIFDLMLFVIGYLIVVFYKRVVTIMKRIINYKIPKKVMKCSIKSKY